jgi:hypothetical protein
VTDQRLRVDGELGLELGNRRSIHSKPRCDSDKTVNLLFLLPHTKKRPALEKFVDEALPLVAVNLEQFAAA